MVYAKLYFHASVVAFSTETGRTLALQMLLKFEPFKTFRDVIDMLTFFLYCSFSPNC